MQPEEFRRQGKQTIDWIAGYLENIESYPVKPSLAPGQIREALPDHPPEQGESFDEVLADLDRIVLPGVTHWQHPAFFAYFPANSSPPAVLGDLLSTGLGVQGMLWATSPACTELETVVVDWLAELLDLPHSFRTDAQGGGVIQDSASSASLVALQGALHRASGGDVVRSGITRRYTIYVSSQTHSSLEKAAGVAGIGRDNVRVVGVAPDTLAMDPQQLDQMLADDVAAGAVPAMVCATVGTTSTTAIDPVDRIGEICRKHGVWLHVDAAYAGVAAICPELRWINRGVADYADSYCTNAHKWLLTSFDCSVLWLADRTDVLASLSILPEYLRTSSGDDVIDYRDWQIPLGRRFRALKLWLVLRSYGAEGLREHVRRGVALAQELASWIDDDPGFELHRPHPLGLVCFRPLWPGLDVDDANHATMTLIETLNDSGDLYLTHTKITAGDDDQVLMRMAVGGVWTERRHMMRAWDTIRDGIAAVRYDHA